MSSEILGLERIGNRHMSDQLSEVAPVETIFREET